MFKQIQSPSFLVLFIAISVFLSCTNDELEADNTNFEIDVDLNSADFVVITNQNNEILFSEEEPNLSTPISFENVSGDIIDVTYGVRRTNDFRIYTYRNVSSDFKINPFFKTDSPSTSSEIWADRTLEIVGLNGEIINNPLRNTVLVDGKYLLSGNTTDLASIYTVFDAASNAYKSIKIEPEDWVLQVDDSYYHTVHVNDFQLSEVHEIELNHTSESSWIVYAFANDGNERVILNKWYNIDDSQEGNTISIYTTQDLSVDDVDLSIETGALSEGFHYNQTGQGIPENIDFVKMQPNFESIGVDNYKVVNDEDYGMANMAYLYLVDNVYSSWEVFQEREASLEYELPSLPDNFLSDPKVAQGISNPTILSSYYYQLDRPIGVNGFTENRGTRIYCERYSNTYLSTEF